ncbi:hypothetical protein THICB3510073 [Thiomonas sp. CB3]|nr:hypothetical protein THICB3510073 [Thiomonas sp. CB3]
MTITINKIKINKPTFRAREGVSQAIKAEGRAEIVLEGEKHKILFSANSGNEYTGDNLTEFSKVHVFLEDEERNGDFPALPGWAKDAQDEIEDALSAHPAVRQKKQAVMGLIQRAIESQARMDKHNGGEFATA